MPTRAIRYVKVVVHILCLLPFLMLLEQYRTGSLLQLADPVNYITHRTGDWALWMLLISLAVTPLRRLHPKLGNLIRFRRMLGRVCILLRYAAPRDVYLSVLRLRFAHRLGGRHARPFQRHHHDNGKSYGPMS